MTPIQEVFCFYCIAMGTKYCVWLKLWAPLKVPGPCRLTRYCSLLNSFSFLLYRLNRAAILLRKSATAGSRAIRCAAAISFIFAVKSARP